MEVGNSMREYITVIGELFKAFLSSGETIEQENWLLFMKLTFVHTGGT